MNGHTREIDENRKRPERKGRKREMEFEDVDDSNVLPCNRIGCHQLFPSSLAVHSVRLIFFFSGQVLNC